MMNKFKCSLTVFVVDLDQRTEMIIFTRSVIEVDSVPCEKSNAELSPKIANVLNLLTIFNKKPIVDV